MSGAEVRRAAPLAVGAWPSPAAGQTSSHDAAAQHVAETGGSSSSGGMFLGAGVRRVLSASSRSSLHLPVMRLRSAAAMPAGQVQP